MILFAIRVVAIHEKQCAAGLGELDGKLDREITRFDRNRDGRAVAVVGGADTLQRTLDHAETIWPAARPPVRQFAGSVAAEKFSPTSVRPGFETSGVNAGVAARPGDERRMASVSRWRFMG